jgi:hypothetical protein
MSEIRRDKQAGQEWPDSGERIDRGRAAHEDRRQRAPFFRRPVVRGTLAAVGVAVIVLVVLSVVNVFGAGGPSIVEKAQAALAVPQNTILHFKTVGVQDNGDGTTATWSDDSWISTADPASARRIETASDTPAVETAVSASGLYQIYDAKADTVYSKQATSSEELEIAASLTKGDEFQWFKDEALKVLQAPDSKVEKNLDFEGREAVRITSGDGVRIYIVDAKTNDPLEWQTKGDGGGSTLRITYEKLPATAANLALTDLAKQHPDAKVDSNADHYQEVLGKLFPKG